MPDLPVAAVAPEYMEQKATIDAIFALALGLYTYVNPVPTVTGAPNLVKLLTQDCKNVTGGLLNVETDAVKQWTVSWHISSLIVRSWASSLAQVHSNVRASASVGCPYMFYLVSSCGRVGVLFYQG